MPLPDFNPSGQTEDEERERRPNPIIGTYSVPPVRTQGTVHGSVGSYGPGSAPSYQWKPYRDRDLRQILNSITRQGSIYDLQLALVQGGFLTDDVAFGWIGPETEQAMEDLLSVANQHGANWQDILSQAAAGDGIQGAAGSGGGALQPNVIQLPNRDDLIAGMDDVGLSLAGQVLDADLNEAAVDSVMDALRTQQERQLQTEMSAAPGSTVFTEAPPDVGRLLEEEVRERAPDEVMDKGVREAMDSWFAALAGPV